MKRNSVLSCVGIILAAISLFTFSEKAQTTSSSVQYENRRPVLNEIYYNQKVDSQPEQVEESTLDKSISVTPPIIVGERELVGLPVSDADINIEDIKQYTYEITDKEKKILERITEAETSGQNEESKMNVASVIINRVNSDSFPDDIESVVFQRYQFSPIGDHRYYEVKVTKGTKKAVDKVLKDGVINKALYFCNPADIESAKNKRWFANLKYLFTDDSNHSFYTE